MPAPSGDGAAVISATGDAASEPAVDAPFDTEPNPTAAPMPTPFPIFDSGRSENSLTSLTVYDGDLGTSWTTSTGLPEAEAYVYLDLGVVQPIGVVRWLFAAEGLAGGMRVQVSEDGDRWATLAEPGNAPVGLWQDLRVDVAGRYVRFIFSNPSMIAYLGGLAELEVLQATGPVAPLTLDPVIATEVPALAGVAAANAAPVGAAAGPYPIAGVAASEEGTGSWSVADANSGTYWATAGDAPPAGAWVQVDLGADQAIGVVRWLFAAEGMADGMEIQASSDGATWTTVAAPGGGPAGFWQEALVGSTGRFVRFTFPNPTQIPAVGGLAEIEVGP